MYPIPKVFHHSVCFVMISKTRQAIDYLNEHYDIRYNKATHRIQFRPHGSEQDFCNLEEHQFNSILTRMDLEGISIRAEALRTLMMSDQFDVYDPYSEWLANLPLWDGHDYIHDLAQKVECTDNAYFEMCLRKWLVAAVGSIADPEVINMTVLVLVGGQGLGKTTFFQRLIPPALRKYCGSGTLPKGEKEAYATISETPIMIFDELEQWLSRDNIEWVKSLITTSTAYIRRAYTKLSTQYVRICSFAGTCNSDAFLRDVSNRRFLCHRVTAIDYQLTGIDLDQLWSQAYQLFRTGFQYWFDQEEQKVVEAHNEAFRMVSLEEELVKTYFMPCRAGEPGAERYQTHELINYLGTQVHGHRVSKERLGRCLSALGFSKIKTRGISKWIVRKRQVNENSGELPD